MKSVSGSLIGTSDGRTINGAWFADDNNGWVVGQDGMIRRTVDGGATWTTEATGTTKAMNGVWGADATHL